MHTAASSRGTRAVKATVLATAVGLALAAAACAGDDESSQGEPDAELPVSGAQEDSQEEYQFVSLCEVMDVEAYLDKTSLDHQDLEASDQEDMGRSGCSFTDLDEDATHLAATLQVEADAAEADTAFDEFVDADDIGQWEAVDFDGASGWQHSNAEFLVDDGVYPAGAKLVVQDENLVLSLKFNYGGDDFGSEELLEMLGDSAASVAAGA